jgi:hypothetical protein
VWADDAARACASVRVAARTEAPALNTTRGGTIGRIAEGEQRQPPIGLKHTLLSVRRATCIAGQERADTCMRVYYARVCSRTRP